MPITALLDGDFVNGAKEKVNDAFGEIPESFELTPTGDLLITRHNQQVETIPLRNYFSLLTTTFESLSLAMATPLVAGKVLLVDDDIPDQLEATNRILSAAQVVTLINKVAGTATAIVNTLQLITEKGAMTDRAVSLFGGLSLDKITFTEEVLPALVLGYDKKVYLSSSLGSSGNQTDEVVYLGCYRKPVEKLLTQDIALVNATDGQGVAHKLRTLTPLLQAWAQLPSGQYQLVTDVTTGSPPSGTLLSINTLYLSVPGNSFTGFLRLTQPPVNQSANATTN